MAAFVLFCLQFICFALTIIGTQSQGGTWQLLNSNAGISSMHAAVTRCNKVILLDRTNVGASNISLPNGKCRNNPYDKTLKTDCSAHSVLFDWGSNTVLPLMIQTDTWCSSGQFLPNGSLLQSGGWYDGGKKFRIIDPCASNGSNDWYEFPNTTQLYNDRWYATNQILPDSSIIIVGGQATNTVEYYNPQRSGGAISFPFLGQMNNNEGDNLYPYVHLLPSGHLFIFCNTQYVLYNYTDNTYITENLPALPGGPRNYPSAGSSAMLPIKWGDTTATIVICGGAQYGAFKNRKVNLTGQNTCGRIVPTDPNPAWEMEDMPEPRIMGEMVMLPMGDVCIINGARAGSQGYGLATNASLYPFLYKPDQPQGFRFTILNPTTIARVYHCTANLLPDGRVLVAGSNTHSSYTWTQPFPTELRVEAFCPDYMSAEYNYLRPVDVNAPKTIKCGGGYSAYVKVPSSLNETVVEVNFLSAPYSTHSFSQGQRCVKSLVTQKILLPDSRWQIKFKAPCRNLMPPGYYMMFVVNNGVPGEAKWVQFTS